MRLIGLILIAVLIAVPLIWLPAIGQGRDQLALFSQYLGMVSLILMTTTQVIATRLPGVEAIFGSLDRAYVLHKWLGVTALVTMFLHDTIDADMRGLRGVAGLGDVAETAGEISYYAILILVVITVATFVPYHLWRWTHRFMGFFFFLAAFHYLFIAKPFANSDPLGVYMGTICGLGILAYLYTLGPAGLRGHHPYEVTSIEPDGASMAITLTPKSKGMRHEAGQFAVFTFRDSGIKEPHPFTLSAAPQDDRSLRITVGALGDFTTSLPKRLEVGQAIDVEGPYGHFTLPRGPKPQVWIGAGIGITPFVALAEALPEDGPQVHLIACARSADELSHIGELRALAERKPNLTLTVHESSKSGRLDGKALVDHAPEIGSSKVMFCGPVPMRKTLFTAAARQGVAQRDFHFEEFEFRTGIGLDRMADWVFNRLRTANS